MFSLDVLVTQAINQAAGKFAVLDAFLIDVSAYAIPVLVAVVAVQWWRRDDKSTVRFTLVSAGLSFLLGLGINQIVLLAF